MDTAATIDYGEYESLQDGWLSFPSYPLERDFDESEYRLRLERARRLMAEAELDALVITSSQIGRWFTSLVEPHEWHDVCQSRSAWFILTDTDDFLFMTPTTAGEHTNTARRATWVSHIRPIVERTEWPRVEIWSLRQMPQIFGRLGLASGRLGFELGDCMTLGLTVNDYLALRELMPDAALVDASPILRRLMSVHTALEIDRVRKACRAGVWIHDKVPLLLQAGMSERELLQRLEDSFASEYQPGYAYRAAGAWDVRNPRTGDSNLFHAAVTDRLFQDGDYVARGTSGVSFLGYPGDVDRGWHLGRPEQRVLDAYRVAWECNRSMAERIRPGNMCSDIYAACARVEEANGFPRRRTGRVGHGIRNTGCLSVHPDNHTVLEPNMIISVEPMLVTDYGWFDLEDQYLVTDAGAEPLHELGPAEMPVILG